jgi:AraC-like DNA-binding protein
MPSNWTLHEPSVPPSLERDVHHVRVFDSESSAAYSVKVAPVALPGLVFHHKGPARALRSLETPQGLTSPLPLGFLYGAGTTPSTMSFFGGPHSTIQIIFKPHGLRSIFGLDARLLRNNFCSLSEMPGAPSERELLAHPTSPAKLDTLLHYLEQASSSCRRHDPLVVRALEWIDSEIHHIELSRLHKDLGVTERQLERRFSLAVGVAPKTYIRIRRFNEALRLMKSGRHATLASIAHELNFADQSHFIRDLKEFARVSPKGLSERAENFHEKAGFSYEA